MKQSLFFNIRTLCGVALLCVAALSRAAPALPDVSLDFTLTPQDNLYFHDWGHAYNQVFDQENPLHLDDPELYGLGAGIPAAAVSLSGSTFDFAPYQSVSVSAEGWIQANNIWWTNPDGDADYIFREQPGYSLIGIWSTSSSTIVPSGDAFFIGSNSLLAVPDLTSAYLFLALNDGWFFDNGEIRPDLTTGELENFYQVGLLASQNPVPVPPAIWLLGSAMAALLWRRRQLA